MELLATCKVKAAIPALVFFILMAPLCSFGRDAPGAGVSDDDLLEEISHAAFLFFIREADPESGLVRDRTGAEYCSAAAMGFGLAALPVGVERCWIDRGAAEA